MKKLLLYFFLLYNDASFYAQSTFQLAPPLMRYPSIYFTKSIQVSIHFDEPNTQIRYTTNGQIPNQNDQLYSKPITIRQGFTTLKTRVFSPIYRTSDVVQATFIQSGITLKSIESTEPHPRYAQGGKAALVDNKGGTASLSSGNWLGFQTDTIDFTLNLNQKQTVKKVFINLLQDINSWIFLPEKMEAYYFDQKSGTFQLTAQQFFRQDKHTISQFCTPSVLNFDKVVKTDVIKLRLYNLKIIPEWHPGKGQKSWIFVDEIKLY